jgi:hypothetical protein
MAIRFCGHFLITPQAPFAAAKLLRDQIPRLISPTLNRFICGKNNFNC